MTVNITSDIEDCSGLLKSDVVPVGCSRVFKLQAVHEEFIPDCLTLEDDGTTSESREAQTASHARRPKSARMLHKSRTSDLACRRPTCHAMQCLYTQIHKSTNALSACTTKGAEFINMAVF